MRISKLSAKITFQKNTTVIDEYHNHYNEWVDYYTCRAWAETSFKNETENIFVFDEQKITFNVRPCAKTKVIRPPDYRIVLNGEAYNILAVDMMDFDNKQIRFRCEREIIDADTYQN